MNNKYQPDGDEADQIDKLLLEGLDSGEPIAHKPESLEEKKRRLETLKASIDDMNAGRGRPVEEMFAEMESMLAKKQSQ